MKINIDVPIVTKTKKEIELPIYVKEFPYKFSAPSLNNPRSLELIRIDEKLNIRRYNIEYHSNPEIKIDYGEGRNSIKFLESLYYDISKNDDSRYEVISKQEFESILNGVLY